MGLFTSICGSNLGLVSGSAMAMDSSQNNGLFIDARMASVFTEKQVIRVFFSPPIGGISIEGRHGRCSESVKSGTLNINFA